MVVRASAGRDEVVVMVNNKERQLAEFITLPYGKINLTFTLPDSRPVILLSPKQAPAAPNPKELVRQALAEPVGDKTLADFAGVESAAIAINDKTRPVPHKHLLPPLLEQLEKLGLPPEKITLLIATGTRPRYWPATRLFATMLMTKTVWSTWGRQNAAPRFG